jgi:hypothetical protein
MSNQLRILVVLVGAAGVVMTFTFPLWQPYLGLLPGRGETALLGLPQELSERFNELPPEQINALLTLAEEEPEQARRLAIAQLTPSIPLEEPVPNQVGQQRVAFGTVEPAHAFVQAAGQLSVYEVADGSHIIRLDELNVTNAPGIGVYLSNSNAPTTREELEANGEYHMLLPLESSQGNQNYEVAAELDLSSYNSVVLYSEELDVVVGYATLISSGL